MATATAERELYDNPISRIRWGAVFSGWVVGLGVQLMLTLLGLGIGMWSLDLRESAQGVSIGTGVWTALSMLVAAFAGGYVTAYLSGAGFRFDGIVHGTVLWGLNWLFFAWLTTTAMAALFGGIFSVVGEGLKAVGSGVGTAVQQIGGRMDLSQLGLSREQLRQQIESTLAATGKPELQPGEIQKEAQQTTEQAEQGQPVGQVSDSAIGEVYEKLAALDEQAAINVMVDRFGMSETQAREVVGSLSGALSRVRSTAQGAKEQSLDIANTALQRMGAAAWWLFVLAVLTLGTTMWGASVGTAADERRSVERMRLRAQREAV